MACAAQGWLCSSRREVSEKILILSKPVNVLPLTTSAVSQTAVFDTLPAPPLKPGFYARISVSKPVSKSNSQYLTYSVSFDTFPASPFYLSPNSPGPAGQGVYVADRGSMHDSEYGFPRTLLIGSWVNRGPSPLNPVAPGSMPHGKHCRAS